jgi:hypothetical protein
MSLKIACKKGSIMRKGYTRHIPNKTIRVRSGCIKAQSQSGKKRSTIDLQKITKRIKIHKKMRELFGTPRCKNGQVIREGYTRKAFVKKSDTRIKVAPGCIKATGLSKRRGKKGKQLFVLEKGTLTKYGYHVNLNEDMRHQSLKKAMHSGLKPLSVFRKLNALYVLNKNKDKVNALIYKKDSEWVKTTAEYMERNN